MDRALGGLARALGLPGAGAAAGAAERQDLLRDAAAARRGVRRSRPGRHQPALAPPPRLLEWGLRRPVGVRRRRGGRAVVAQPMSTTGATSARWRSRLPALERDAASAKASPATELTSLLPALDALSAAGARERERPRRSRRIVPGLDRSEMLAARPRDAYLRALREAFLPRIAARLEQRLRAGEREHVELIYDTLKAYLMLFGGKNFDRDALRGYLIADWDADAAGRASSAAQRDALRRAPRPPARQRRGRRAVECRPAADRAGARRGGQRAAGATRLPAPEADRPRRGRAPFSVESSAGAGARRVFVRASGQPLGSGVPALYSRAVFQQSLRERTQEVLRQLVREQAWVLGRPRPPPTDAAATKALADEVQRLVPRPTTRAALAAVHRRSAPGTGDHAGRQCRTGQPAGAARLAACCRCCALRRASCRSMPPPQSLGRTLRARCASTSARQPAPIEATQAVLAKLAAHLTAVDDAVKRKALPPASDVLNELARGRAAGARAGARHAGAVVDVEREPGLRGDARALVAPGRQRDRAALQPRRRRALPDAAHWHRGDVARGVRAHLRRRRPLRRLLPAPPVAPMSTRRRNPGPARRRGRRARGSRRSAAAVPARAVDPRRLLPRRRPAPRRATRIPAARVRPRHRRVHARCRWPGAALPARRAGGAERSMAGAGRQRPRAPAGHADRRRRRAGLHVPGPVGAVSPARPRAHRARPDAGPDGARCSTSKAARRASKSRAPARAEPDEPPAAGAIQMSQVDCEAGTAYRVGSARSRTSATSRRAACPRPSSGRWDRWLQDEPGAARATISASAWRDAYLVAPIQRFWVAPGVLGDVGLGAGC